MQLNGPSKPLKMHSLLLLPQQTQTSHFNCETSLDCRCKTLSTLCMPPELTQKIWHTRPPMAFMTGEDIPLHPQGENNRVQGPNLQRLMASHGTNAWCLGPSSNHYQCNLYYVPATGAYCISSLAELFPQHCKVPSLTPNQHLCALDEELATSTTAATTTPKGRQLIKLLWKQLNDMLQTVAIVPEQSVTKAASEQRVTANAATPIVPAPTVPLQRVTNAPAIMIRRDPTAKHNLILTKQITRDKQGTTHRVMFHPSHGSLLTLFLTTHHGNRLG
jgi:hypothetical protein